ncbi:heme exporter protein CcmD [Aquabacter sp. CN5-332]|uniref:heme exporter protein CcmD n=1 Tax=Aquabacter sp. CN5-332 TaxID=3156608 RepID=UPI0032B45637
MSHTLFIAAAYGVAALGLAALTLHLVLDNRAQRRALAELEARGVRRRSERRQP